MVVTIASVLALIELREASKARYLDVRTLIQEMNVPALRDARRFVYTEMPSDRAQLSGESLKKVEMVLVSFDEIGVLVAQGLLPRQMALDVYAEIVTRAWRKVLPFVRFERERRGMSRYMIHAEILANLAEQHIQRHYPDERLGYY
jgi:hypothetical protein